MSNKNQVDGPHPRKEPLFPGPLSLENLEAAVEDRLGFAVVDHEVKLYGYCRDCREKMDQD